jgi:hypothetical protein
MVSSLLMVDHKTRSAATAQAHLQASITMPAVPSNATLSSPLNKTSHNVTAAGGFAAFCIANPTDAFCKDDKDFASSPDTLRMVHLLVENPDYLRAAPALGQSKPATVAVPDSDTIWPRNMKPGNKPAKDGVIATFGGSWPSKIVQDLFMERATAYAQKHNYDIYVQEMATSLDTAEVEHIRLATISYLLKLNYKFVFWTDMDSLIMDMDVTLESLLPIGVDLVAAPDSNMFINSEHMLWRNTKWSKDLIKTCTYMNPQPTLSGGRYVSQSSGCLAYMLSGEDQDCTFQLTEKCATTIDPRLMKVKLTKSMGASLANYEKGDIILGFGGLPMLHKRSIMVRYRDDAIEGKKWLSD